MPTPQKVNLFGNEADADAVKMRLNWSGVSLSSIMTGVLMKRTRRKAQRHTDGTPPDQEGRVHLQAKECHRWRVNRERVEEASEDSPQQSSEDTNPAHTLISDFQVSTAGRGTVTEATSNWHTSLGWSQDDDRH